MKQRIEDCLHRLYAPGVVDRVLIELETLLEHFRAQSGSDRATGRAGLSVAQNDVLLITYADQVSQPGQAPLRTLAAFCEAHLRDAVSGVHLLPFHPWSSDDGFSVKDYREVNPAYGDWANVARLEKSFDLMLDAVFNHLSVQGDWFQRFQRDEPEFRDFFVTVEGNPDLSKVVRPRALPLLTEFQTARGPRRVWTTFSADQADLNFKNPRVLLAIINALLSYVQRGARFIRLDAIAFLWKEAGTTCLHLPQTHAIVQFMRAVLDEVAPETLLITETNVPHVDNVSYFGDGTNEAQLVYNFSLAPLVLHSFARGNAEKLTRWTQSLALPSRNATFFNFLASHDGIGLNPVRGILSDEEIDTLVKRTRAHGGFISTKAMPDGSQAPYEMNINYLDALSSPLDHEPAEQAARKFLTAHAILLSLQGMPGIYFHSLFGSRGDRAGAIASGIPRRINREKLDRMCLEGELADAHSLRSRIWRGLEKLLRIRRAQSAFHPQAAQKVLDIDRRLFAVRRISSGNNERLLCLHNVSDEPISITGLGTEMSSVKAWTDLLTGRRYVPEGVEMPSVEMDAFQSLWLRAEDAQ
jgi:sucrose phosphorylase